MANQILIRFATQALDKAKESAKAIAASVKEAAKGIKDVEERRAFLKEARAAAKERREELRGAEGRLALEKRAAGLTRSEEIDRAAEKAVIRVLGAANRAGQFAGGIARVVTSDDPTGTKGLQLGLHSLASAGVPVVSQVAGIVSQVVEILDAKEQVRLQRVEGELRERIDKALAEADVQRRYQDDANYRRKLNDEARSLYTARRDSGWEPRGAAFLHGDE